MKLALLALVFSSSLIIASDKDWKKTVVAEDCGQSQGEAKKKMEGAAQNEANFYQSVCEGAKGSFTMKWSQTSCDADPQSLVCNVVCSVMGTASCSF